MKDFKGQDIQIGDAVIFISKSKKFTVGLVMFLGKKKITLDYRGKEGKILRAFRYPEEVYKVADKNHPKLRRIYYE